MEQLSKINEKIILEKKIPFIFGGEHSLTAGSIKPFTKKYKELIIVHFDAHADLRESYNGEKYSHASAIKRCLDFKMLRLFRLG